MIDKMAIIVKGGDGGDGAVSFRREKFVPNGGPDGGDGGRGANIYLLASNDVRDFEHLRHTKLYCGSNGERGGKAGKAGKGAEDLVIKVPVGTRGTFGSLESDLIKEGQKILIVSGGQGGIGNARYWRLKAKRTGRRPHGFWDRREKMMEARPGDKGEERILNLELRILADVGIVGLPNSGKSTLLAKLTKATPKIADYPFTTLEPNLGVMPGYYPAKGGTSPVVLADIPGLIEGASRGKGLGFEFLRHISRTKILIHILALAGFEKDPKEAFEKLLKEYKTVRGELRSYNPELLKKKEIILLNKVDIVDNGFAKTLLTMFSKQKMEVLGISCKTGDGLKELEDVIIRESKGL